MPRPSNPITTHICEKCGKEFPFRDSPSHIKRGYGRFCSQGCTPQKTLVPLAERFPSYLSPTNANGCILWSGGKDPDGYGKTGTGGGKVSLYAHRVAWELVHGPIPDGLRVLHRCDNPPCVNVEHLFLGTDADNVADRTSKNRQACGERSGMARLKETQVREIRILYANGGWSHDSLANTYHVCYGTIWNILNNKTWKHVK